MSRAPGAATGPRRVGVAAHPRYALAHSALRQVCDWAEARGIEMLLEPEVERPSPTIGILRPEDLPGVDLLITLGGDGTLLRAARLVAPYGVPVLGINLGHLGFLTSLGPKEIVDGLAAVSAGDIVHDERMVLEVHAEAADGTSRGSSLALNDAVLHRGGVARMIRLAVHAHGEEVGTYSADGIIFSTPTGSTAYSLSAGGPIVAPVVDCIIATPICPHTLAVRPLILPAAETIRVEVLTPTEELILTIDGQESASLTPGDRMVVSRAPEPLRLVRFPGQTFFSTLRRKLRWGDLEEREK